jgi:hypothetical protein
LVFDSCRHSSRLCRFRNPPVARLLQRTGEIPQQAPVRRVVVDGRLLARQPAQQQNLEGLIHVEPVAHVREVPVCARVGHGNWRSRASVDDIWKRVAELGVLHVEALGERHPLVFIL